MECIYCKKVYSAQSSLKYHQKSTKSCIKIQLEQGLTLNKLEFTCQHCDKSLTTKSNLIKHVAICRTKIKEDKITNVKQQSEEKVKTCIKRQEELELELRLKDEKIKCLEEQLKQKQPQIINNTKQINHITNVVLIQNTMKPESVSKSFKENYDLAVLLEGVPGVAKFLREHFLVQGGYYCSDRSRNRFFRIDEKCNKIEDPNCDFLVSLALPGFPHITRVYLKGLRDAEDQKEEEVLHQSYLPITQLDTNRNQLITELSKITPSPNDLSINQDLKKEFQKMRDTYERSQPNKNDKKDELVPQMIGPFTLGALDVYRKGYQKRKEEGIDIIKAPKLLIELMEKDVLIRSQYIEFLNS
jgi:hypothetical protein